MTRAKLYFQQHPTTPTVNVALKKKKNEIRRKQR